MSRGEVVAPGHADADTAATPGAVADRADGSARSRLAREGPRWPGQRVLHNGYRILWWFELLMVLGFYGLYSAIRNSTEGAEATAFSNARHLIRLEEALGIYHEELLQSWALSWQPLIVCMNYFYGSFHLILTAIVGIWLFRKHSDDYPLWRNTLLVTTSVALVGFITWPLMPPRLLPASYGFVDTLAQYPTFWSFNSGAISEISNQYAAMPSLHVAWALWVVCVLFPRTRSHAVKGFALAYPVLTVIAIVLTGNHYFLDAVGGFAALGIGYIIARIITRAGRQPSRSARVNATAGGG
jgi:hypothetical protein